MSRRLLCMEPTWSDLGLRAVTLDDLPAFFAHQLDAEANRMAAFTAKDLADENAFIAH